MVRIPNPCFLYPSVSSDWSAAPVEYKSFSVRLISQEEKEPVLASSSSLGQEQIHSGTETLNTHTKVLLTQLLVQPLPKPVRQLSSTWNSSRGLQLPYQGNLKLAQFNLSSWKLQWFRISFMCNSTRCEKAPSEKLTGGSYWFSHLPLINLYWCPNTIGIKYGPSPNLGLVLKDRLNLEVDPCKTPYSPLCQLTFQFWCASWNANPFHIYHGLKSAAMWDVLGSSGWVRPTTATSGVLCSKTALRTEYVDPEISLHNGC